MIRKSGAVQPWQGGVEVSSSQTCIGLRTRCAVLMGPSTQGGSVLFRFDSHAEAQRRAAHREPRPWRHGDAQKSHTLFDSLRSDGVILLTRPPLSASLYSRIYFDISRGLTFPGLVAVCGRGQTGTGLSSSARCQSVEVARALTAVEGGAAPRYAVQQ